MTAVMNEFVNREHSKNGAMRCVESRQGEREDQRVQEVDQDDPGFWQAGVRAWMIVVPIMGLSKRSPSPFMQQPSVGGILQQRPRCDQTHADDKVPCPKRPQLTSSDDSYHRRQDNQTSAAFEKTQDHFF